MYIRSVTRVVIRRSKIKFVLGEDLLHFLSGLLNCDRCVSHMIFFCLGFISWILYICHLMHFETNMSFTENKLLTGRTNKFKIF